MRDEGLGRSLIADLQQYLIEDHVVDDAEPGLLEFCLKLAGALVQALDQRGDPAAPQKA